MFHVKHVTDKTGRTMRARMLTGSLFVFFAVLSGSLIGDSIDRFNSDPVLAAIQLALAMFTGAIALTAAAACWRADRWAG